MSSKPISMPPMGGAGDNDAGAQPDQHEGPGTPNANYTGPENQCNACQYFDGRGKCSNQELLGDIPDGTVDPSGRCDEWEPGAGGPKTPAPGGSNNDLGRRIAMLGKSQPGGIAAGPMGPG